jgi:hypothetical protein
METRWRDRRATEEAHDSDSDPRAAVVVERRGGGAAGVMQWRPEGPEKATRGGVNGSQSKLLTVTWSISQTSKSDTPPDLIKPDKFSAQVKSD